MKTTRAKGTLGIVLKMEPSSAGAADYPYSAHLILNRCVIDDDGNICVTAPAGLLGVLDLVDLLKAELDGLANEAVLCLAQAIALRGPRQDGIANDNDHGAPGGGEDRVGANPPPPLGLRPPPGLAMHPALTFFPPGQSP